MVALAAPRNVSPVIRFSRWGALVLGLAYGTYRYNSLVKKEKSIQEYENEIKAKRAVRLAAENAAKSQAEMSALGKEAGVV